MKRLLPLFSILLGGVLAAGCDSIAGALGVDEVEVPLTSAGTMSVNGDQLTSTSGSTTRSGGKLPNVFDLESVVVAKEDVTYTPSSSKNGSAASGHIYGTVFINDKPLGTFDVTIANDAVSNVTITPFQVTPFIVAACGGAPSQCPAASAYQGKSVAQIKGELETILRTAETLGYRIVVKGDTAALKGSLRVNKVTLNLDF